MSINDQVDSLHITLVTEDLTVEDPAKKRYRRLLSAVYDEEAVEGSVAADDIMAAQIIRDLAVKTNIPDVVDARLATIVKALNVVLRRYGQSRRERRAGLGIVKGDGWEMRLS